MVQRVDIAAMSGIVPASAPAGGRSLILGIGPERLSRLEGPGGASDARSAMSRGGSSGPRNSSKKTATKTIIAGSATNLSPIAADKRTPDAKAIPHAALSDFIRAAP